MDVRHKIFPQPIVMGHSLHRYVQRPNRKLILIGVRDCGMNTERSRDFQLSSAIVIGVAQIMKIRSLSIIPLLWSFTLFGLAPMGHAVGPGSSVEISQDSQKTHRYADLKTNTRLNVIVPVFDPNFPEDPDDYEKQGIWPEVRNTEAKLFALRLRDTLQDSGAFGAVRVTPTDEAVGDLYVTGRILESTSEIVKIEISVQDISQKLWFRSPQKFGTQSARIPTSKRSHKRRRPLCADLCRDHSGDSGEAGKIQRTRARSNSRHRFIGIGKKLL